MCDCRSVSACVSLSVCGRYTRASPAFVLRCAVFPPPPATRTHKVSFPQLSEGEGGKGGEAGRGVGREVPQLRCPGRSSQPRSGARPAAPAAPGRDRTAPGELPVGAENLGPVQPPGTWGSARVTARETALPTAVGALGREGGLEPGPVPTAAFLPPRESPGRPPHPALPAGLGSPFPGPQRPAPRGRGRQGRKGLGPPPLRRALPLRPAPDVLSRCTVPLPLGARRHPPPPQSAVCFFRGNWRDGRREGARPESDPGTDTHKRTKFLEAAHTTNSYTHSESHLTYRGLQGTLLVLKQKTG